MLILGKIGIVLVSLYYEPLTDSDEDEAAADRGVQWAVSTMDINLVVFRF